MFCPFSQKTLFLLLPVLGEKAGMRVCTTDVHSTDHIHTANPHPALSRITGRGFSSRAESPAHRNAQHFIRCRNPRDDLGDAVFSQILHTGLCRAGVDLCRGATGRDLLADRFVHGE